ncbi:MAG TPA: SDR family NAD(P)-dependent oxidoreductase [Candidatus Solibacter sp.]|jgi:short-subunit dehydrogenase|nr:SDR family NAD(P)-dependent oxidoreductase [Candidatus Solibacter sp.]
MRYELRGRTAVVTGASSGIGRELALQLARKGVRLALVARREALLESLAKQVVADGGEPPLVLAVDLSKRGGADAVAASATKAFGSVDILVNNAGGGVGGAQWHVGDREEARDAFEVNFWSPLALTAALVPSMLERKSGVVVNVTSLAKVMTWAAMGHYAATKAALSIATETLQLELTGSGIRVLEVLPGPVDTAIQAESRLAPGLDELLAMSPQGKAPRLATMIVAGIERGASRVVYPSSLAATYHLPGIARAITRRKARKLDGALDRLDPLVIRTGSQGDPIALEARAAWEQEHSTRQR